jgi:hypothetical protein
MKDLADVRASQAAALSSSLIARIDEPQPDNNPVGPGFPTIVAAGFGGGLLLGLGLVFLTAPLGNLWGRRASDYAGRGRRAGDQVSAAPPESSAAPSGRRASDAPRVASRPTERMPTLTELAAAKQAAKAQAR